MPTTLLTTGAHMYAPNRPRALSTCPSTVYSAVEEHLGDAPERERGRQRQPLAGLVDRVDPHQQRRAERERDGHPEQRRHREGHQPVDELLPAVGGLGRPDDLRHEHGVEHAAGQQHVEDVRDLVRDVEGVGRGEGQPERGHEHQRAAEPEHPRHGGPGGHHRAGAQQPRAVRAARACPVVTRTQPARKGSRPRRTGPGASCAPGRRRAAAPRPRRRRRCPRSPSRRARAPGSAPAAPSTSPAGLRSRD